MPSVRTRLGAALAAVVLLALTACTDTTVVAEPTEKDEPAASAGKSPRPLGGETPGPAHCRSDAVLHGEGVAGAVEKFGRDSVLRAYCDAATLLTKQAFRPSLMRKQRNFNGVDFAAPREWMSVRAARDWDARVARIVNGRVDYDTPEAWDAQVSALMMYHVTFSTGGFELLPGPGPRRSDVRVSGARPWVEPGSDGGRLWLELTVSADLPVTDGKTPHVWPLTKVLEVAFVESGDPAKPWLIDEWTGRVSSGFPTPLHCLGC